MHKLTVLLRSHDRLNRIHKLSAYIQAEMGIGTLSGEFFDELKSLYRYIKTQEETVMTYKELERKYPEIPSQLLYRVIDNASHCREVSEDDRRLIGEFAEVRSELIRDLSEWL